MGCLLAPTTSSARSYLRVRIEADKKACPILLSNGNLIAQASPHVHTDAYAYTRRICTHVFRQPQASP